eukprot:Skav223426  [mRNA]  locus=scaffold350:440943:444458:+ [translate_table: standard]
MGCVNAPPPQVEQRAPPPPPVRSEGGGPWGSECEGLGVPSPMARWEKEEGQWRSYPLNDSIELDRYWSVFAAAGNEAGYYFQSIGGNVKAKLKLLKNDVVHVPETNVHFTSASFKIEDMQTEAGIKVETAADQMFDFRYVQDRHTALGPELGLVTNHVGMPRETNLGGKEYYLPIGWKRFAVQVKGSYDAGALAAATALTNRARPSNPAALA